jgi:hypothetical protein
MLKEPRRPTDERANLAKHQHKMLIEKTKTKICCAIRIRARRLEQKTSSSQNTNTKKSHQFTTRSI